MCPGPDDHMCVSFSATKEHQIITRHKLPRDKEQHDGRVESQWPLPWLCHALAHLYLNAS